MDNNLALVLHGIKDLRLEDRPVPEPQTGEVQLSVRSVGICGSDLSFWKHGRIGDNVVRKPMIIGHEPSGVVTKLGPGVTNLAVGDRVAIEPNQPCGSCYYCKIGRYNVCANNKYLSTPPNDGCLTIYHCHAASFVHRLPDSMSFDEGALVQPLALGFQACEKGGVTVGHYVLVIGAGPLGMAVVLAARARGASKICVTDLSQERLDYVKKIGADVTVIVGEEEPLVTSEKVVKAIGRHVDVSIECSGHYSGTSNAIYSTRATGTVVQVGLGSATVDIPLVTASMKELDIKGMVSFANNYEKVIEAIASGLVNAKQLVTHRYRLEDSLEAFNTALRKEGIKIIIDCQGDKSSCPGLLK